MCFFKVKHSIGHDLGHDPDLTFFKGKFLNSYISGIVDVIDMK